MMGGNSCGKTTKTQRSRMTGAVSTDAAHSTTGKSTHLSKGTQRRTLKRVWQAATASFRGRSFKRSHSPVANYDIKSKPNYGSTNRKSLNPFFCKNLSPDSSNTLAPARRAIVPTLVSGMTYNHYSIVRYSNIRRISS